MEKSGKVGQRNGICKGTVWFVMDGRRICESWRRVVKLQRS